MPLEAALAHAELSRHGAGEPQRQWHLEQAQTLLHKLGIADNLTHSSDPPAR
jgi:hypothetical protein